MIKYVERSFLFFKCYCYNERYVFFILIFLIYYVLLFLSKKKVVGDLVGFWFFLWRWWGGWEKFVGFIVKLFVFRFFVLCVYDIWFVVWCYRFNYFYYIDCFKDFLRGDRIDMFSGWGWVDLCVSYNGVIFLIVN